MRDVLGSHVLVANSVELLNYDKMIELNDTAAFLYNSFQEGEEVTIDKMVSLLTDRYEVDAQSAKNDCENTFQLWTELGLLV